MIEVVEQPSIATIPIEEATQVEQLREELGDFQADLVLNYNIAKIL